MCFKCLLLPVSTVCFLPRPLQAVDYHGISLSRKFEVYVRATAELKRVDLMNVTRNEKVAFFINVYNALVIHAFVVQGPPNNLWKRFRVSVGRDGGIAGMACSTQFYALQLNTVLPSDTLGIEGGCDVGGVLVHIKAF